VGYVENVKFPQKVRSIRDDSLDSVVGSFLTPGKWKISQVGDMSTIHPEMQKYDVPKTYAVSKNMYKTWRSYCLKNLHLALDTSIYPWKQTCSNTDVLLSLKKSGAGGVGFKGKKEDLLFKLGAFALNVLDHPRWALTTYPTVWTTLQKEEVRLSEKNPRTFQFPHAIYHLVGTKVSLNLNNSFKKNWKETPFVVGFSPQNDLDDLFSRWLKDGILGTLVTWDGVNFDRSLPRFIMKIVRDYRMTFAQMCELHGDKNDHSEIIKLVYKQLIDRVHILPDGTLYYTTGGNPSGSPNTTFDNCLAHLILFCIMHKLHCMRFQDFPHPDFTDFVTEVGLSFFGDDGAAACHDEATLNFFREVPKYWSQLTDRECKMEFHETLDSFVFLGYSYFLKDSHYYFYGADPSKTSFGLLERSMLCGLEPTQAQRVLGQWQSFSNLLMLDGPTSDYMTKSYEFFKILDNLLMVWSNDGVLSADLNKVFLRDRAHKLLVGVIRD